MPAPIVGRRFGVGDIALPDREKTAGIKSTGNFRIEPMGSRDVQIRAVVAAGT